MAAPQVIDISLLSFLYAVGGTVAAVVANYAITQAKVNDLQAKCTALQVELAEVKSTTVTEKMLQLHLTNIDTKFSQVLTSVNEMKEMLRNRVTHE